MLNVAVVRPMPSAKARTAIALSAGLLTSERSVRRTSETRLVIWVRGQVRVTTPDGRRPREFHNWAFWDVRRDESPRSLRLARMGRPSRVRRGAQPNAEWNRLVGRVCWRHGVLGATIRDARSYGRVK